MGGEVGGFRFGAEEEGNVESVGGEEGLERCGTDVAAGADDGDVLDVGGGGHFGEVGDDWGC